MFEYTQEQLKDIIQNLEETLQNKQNYIRILQDSLDIAQQLCEELRIKSDRLQEELDQRKDKETPTLYYRIYTSPPHKINWIFDPRR